MKGLAFDVAHMLGVYWARRDLVHFHDHFSRESAALDAPARVKPTPKHLVESNSQPHWTKYQTLFKDRKSKGFPGHEPSILI